MTRAGDSGEVLSGIGWDSHRLAAGRPLILGGVHIPAARGPVAHSDGDVLAHAIIDALLGAGGLGDIGQHFPDSDQRYRGANSLELLAGVVDKVRSAGLRLVNVDATVLAEQPRLGPHREDIQASLARVLGLAARRVNVKATTGEGMGFVGRGEGIAALAVAALRSAD